MHVSREGKGFAELLADGSFSTRAASAALWDVFNTLLADAIEELH
jgi:hypothetical protein